MTRFGRISRCAVVAALLGMAPAAHASFPGRNGPLAVLDYHDPYVNGVLRITPSGHPQNALQARLFTGCTLNEASQEPNFLCTPSGTSQPPLGRPSFSRDGRELVIGGGRLALLDRDGTGLRMLPQFTPFDDDPSFFPSARVVAFDGALSTRQSSATGEYVDRAVFTVRVDGTQLKRLTADGYYPDVSPTGRWIAFDRNGPGGRVDLWLMRSSGSDEHLLAIDAKYPSFSPDGRHVAFASIVHGVSVIERIDLNGTGRRLLALRGSYPAWSPDGRLIAYTHTTVVGGQPDESDLWLIPANGGTRRRLAYDNPVSEDDSQFLDVAWEPLAG